MQAKYNFRHRQSQCSKKSSALKIFLAKFVRNAVTAVRLIVPSSCTIPQREARETTLKSATNVHCCRRLSKICGSLNCIYIQFKMHGWYTSSLLDKHFAHRFEEMAAKPRRWRLLCILECMLLIRFPKLCQPRHLKFNHTQF